MGKRNIVICDSCDKASCWLGVNYCDNYKAAGTVLVSRDYLEKLDLEDSSYWEPNQSNNGGKDNE
jgi:hypothetical protein